LCSRRIDGAEGGVMIEGLVPSNPPLLGPWGNLRLFAFAYGLKAPGLLGGQSSPCGTQCVTQVFLLVIV
jgi:hypothetical protein